VLALNAELREIIDGFQRTDVEFTLAGYLADSLHRGDGIQKSIDLVLWPEDRDVAESAVGRLGFQRAGRLRPAEAGRYNVQRFIKTNGADILKLNLVVPASLVTAALLGECATLVWQGRTVKIAGWPSINAAEREAPGSFRYLALCLLELFWPDNATWGERDLLPRFEAVVASPESATPDDIEALLVGLRCQCDSGWPRRDIVQMVDALPAGLAVQSPALAAYLRAVRAACALRKEIRCYFRHTLAGLEWA
jgi:hypothetical protein